MKITGGINALPDFFIADQITGKLMPDNPGGNPARNTINSGYCLNNY
jgi:hypothetical protein